MYLPKHFEITDDEEALSFIEANSFGQLISIQDDRLFSTHLPFLVNRDKGRLQGHLAIQNPQYADIQGQEVLLTFQGPHDYISPSWFTTPGVPTWNYQAVHIYGTCRILRDPEQIADIVNALTDKHESVFAQPWKPEYKPAMLSAIVGLEFIISEIQCKYKLSQNRVQPDQTQICEQLEALGLDALASAMRKNRL